MTCKLSFYIPPHNTTTTTSLIHSIQLFATPPPPNATRAKSKSKAVGKGRQKISLWPCQDRWHWYHQHLVQNYWGRPKDIFWPSRRQEFPPQLLQFCSFSWPQDQIKWCKLPASKNRNFAKNGIFFSLLCKLLAKPPCEHPPTMASADYRSGTPSLPTMPFPGRNNSKWSWLIDVCLSAG